MAKCWRLGPMVGLAVCAVLVTAWVALLDALRPPSTPPSVGTELLVRWQPDALVRGMPPVPASLVHVGRHAALGIDIYRADAADAAAALDALRRDPAVEVAEPNRPLRLLASPNDPRLGDQWNMRQIQAPEAWEIGTGGSDVVVAVLDSGIDPSHPDLAGRVVPGRNVRERTANTRDEIGHGTHVAGVIGALGNNGVGVAGISWGVRLMPIKITDRFGDASILGAAEGIRWAADNGARIINLSFGGLDDSQTVRLAVREARGRGILLVAAAGNCGEVASFQSEGCDSLNPPIYPAALDEVIAVGALDATGQLAPYSETGDYIRLTAPGGAGGSQRGNPRDYILSTWPPGLTSPIDQTGYNYEVGTSMAAPHVAGTAALIWSTNPTLTRDEVETILFESADDLGAPGRDDRYGYGRLNAQRAIQRAASLPGSRANDIRIILDSPQPDVTLGTTLSVQGWAVDTQAEGTTGIDLVEAYLDQPPAQGQPLGSLQYGVARPDVARLLGRGGFANAGFTVGLDVPRGAHTLTIRAHSALSGAWSVQQTRFVATGPLMTPIVLPAPIATPAR
jgi:subtilisin family serine protease